jgi:transcription termination/antitermination protein NusA
MDLKFLLATISQIAEDKNIPQEKVMEALNQALAAAYKKEYGKKGQKIEAQIDPKTGELKFWQIKEVVDESRIFSEKELQKMAKKEESLEESEKEEGAKEKKVKFNPERHIMIEEARKENPQIKVGDLIKIPLQTDRNFGRIASQTAKQVILQKLREAERDSIIETFKSKEGQVISGIVQRVEENMVFLDIGRTIGYLPKTEQTPGEFYRPGQRIKVFVLQVESTNKGPKILLSRSHPKLVSRLFELEVPEIAAGQIEIKAIAREPGSRTKIAVFSKEPGLDPVGSCIGQRGSRVGAVISELGGEKIDIIEYSENHETFIKNALSPAKVLDLKIGPKNTALCFVSKDQLSLAIGRDGQNVRLAAKLTGWKIDVEVAPENQPESKIKENQEKEEENPQNQNNEDNN